MTREALERRQVWIYLAAIGAGLFSGMLLTSVTAVLETMLWPALVLLLYATFLQVPLLHIRDAAGDRRFTIAVLVANFAILPAVVWGLSLLLPPDPALRLGVLLVLLVPCTDWFVTFTQLGGGDTSRAIAITPLNLLLQLALLPAYLWLMGGADLGLPLGLQDTWPALLVILIPLVLAALTERWIEARPERRRVREAAAWWPVPLLALVVLLIAAAQIGTVRHSLDVLPTVVPIYLAFLSVAALLARVVGRILRLPVDQTRTLAFTLGTRNSFVVLPIALALPAGWALTTVVIVVQSLVELLGMVVYLKWLPRWR